VTSNLEDLPRSLKPTTDLRGLAGYLSGQFGTVEADHLLRTQRETMAKKEDFGLYCPWRGSPYTTPRRRIIDTTFICIWARGHFTGLFVIEIIVLYSSTYHAEAQKYLSVSLYRLISIHTEYTEFTYRVHEY
jgi:hypothetical protein